MYNDYIKGFNEIVDGKRDIGPKDLIPYYYKIREKMESFDDIKDLGKGFINFLIEGHIQESDNYTRHIGKINDYLLLFKDKNCDKIIEESKKYSCPDDVIMGLRDGQSKSLEPIDMKSLYRDGKSTTLNMCGWCDYHDTVGSCRYSYSIENKCEILTTAQVDDKDSYKANQKCLLHELSSDKIDRIIIGLNVDIGQNAKYKNVELDMLGILNKLLIEANDDVPMLPCFRPSEWCNDGDRVLVSIDNFDNRIVEDKFSWARVVSGYRSHDGCISAEAEKVIHSGDYGAGRGMGMGCSRWNIWKENEMGYILEHKDFAEKYFCWCDSGQNHLPVQKFEEFYSELIDFVKNNK